MFRFLLAILLAPTLLLAAPQKIMVSVAPTKYLVERIAHGIPKTKLIVEKFVPQGASPHSYEPTSRQMLDAAQGKIWFCIGEDFESRARTFIENTMHVVSLKEGLDTLSSTCHCHSGKNYDPHIWLSPRLLKVQSYHICQALCLHFPQWQKTFENNCALLTQELDALDAEIRTIIEKSAIRTILVTHAAFGYFCHDYGLKQLAIEVDGKEPSPKELMKLLLNAKEAKVDRIFIEPQHSIKGGLRVAQELDIQVLTVDPYKENVIENLKVLAKLFTDS